MSMFFDLVEEVMEFLWTTSQCMGPVLNNV